MLPSLVAYLLVADRGQLLPICRCLCHSSAGSRGLLLCAGTLELEPVASTRTRPYPRFCADDRRVRGLEEGRTADGAASREYDDWHASASRRATRETDGTSQYAEGTLPRHPIHDLPFGEQSGFEQRDRPSGFGFNVGEMKGATRQRGPTMLSRCCHISYGISLRRVQPLAPDAVLTLKKEPIVYCTGSMLGRACPSAWNCCGGQSVAWKRCAGELQERCTLHQHRPAIRRRPRSKRTTCGVLNDNLPQRLEVSPQRSPPRV